jgi:hypothetical protein
MGAEDPMIMLEHTHGRRTRYDTLSIGVQGVDHTTVFTGYEIRRDDAHDSGVLVVEEHGLRTSKLSSEYRIPRVELPTSFYAILYDAVGVDIVGGEIHVQPLARVSHASIAPPESQKTLKLVISLPVATEDASQLASIDDQVTTPVETGCVGEISTAASSAYQSIKEYNARTTYEVTPFGVLNIGAALVLAYVLGKVRQRNKSKQRQLRFDKRTKTPTRSKY